MTLATPPIKPAIGQISTEKTPLVFLAFVYVLTSFGLIAVNFPDVQALDLPRADDYMRLQQVRDWLDGQAWHDVDQRRFVTDDGGDMHFSRFPDVLMAGLILLFRPLFGERGAEIAMLTAYPIMLLLAFFLVTTKLAMLVGGRRAGIAAIAVLPFAHAALLQFMAGRVDHHNLEILLLMCALYCAVRAVEKPKWSFGVAASLIAMMVIAMETLPFVVTITLGLGVAWLAKGRRDLMLYFGVGLVVLAFPPLFLEKAGGNPFTIACDAYSPVFATAATMAGLGAMGLGLLTPRLQTMHARLLAAAGAGVIAVGISALLYPDCLSAGPLSMIERDVREFWFQYGPAVRSAPRVLFVDGEYYLAYRYLIPIVGVLAAIKLILEHRDGKRLQLIIIGLAAGVAVILSLWQFRMAPLAAALAVPPTAIMLGQIRERLKDFSPRSILRAGLAGLFVSPVPYVAASFVVATVMTVNASSEAESGEVVDMRGICSDTGHIGALRALPAGLFMNQFNFGIGQRMVVLTDHSISSAFYHRNGRGALRSVRFYDGAADKAVCELSQWRVDYVLYCPITERMGAYDLDKQSLGEMLQSGETPAWLKEINVEDAGPLRVFRPKLTADIHDKCRAE